MPQWLPWLLMGMSGIVFLGLAWYMVAGGEDDEIPGDGADPLSITASEKATDPFAQTTEEQRGSAGRKSRVNALKESLERSLDEREGIRGSDKDRMLMPWFMLVGADGSGKKTILGNNGLEQPWGAPIEVDSVRKDAGKWWLYDDAVVLEAPAASPGATAGSSTLPPDQTVADASIGWNTLLHMLRRDRPDSPLNGVIVTIGCADLIAARSNPAKLEEQAERIRVFLEQTRRFLGVRLPVHVLVTKCDVLPGFRSFVDALPSTRRQDAFGWANPSHPELRFEPTWVDAGFLELQKHLGNLRDELLAAPEQVRDSVGVFLFDSEFADLQEPLKIFVARFMPIGERRPSMFFRGFYFTGDVIDSQAVPQPRVAATVSENPIARNSAEVAKQPHNLVFLRTLFSNRIFREAGLARPDKRLRLARDRRVVFAQAAALVLALGGGFGLWTSVNGLQAADRGQAGLRSDAELLTRVLSGVAIDLDELKKGDPLGNSSPISRRARDAAVIELVGQMRAMPSTQMRSAFIPSSWFSRLPDEIRVSIRAGMSDIVLPVTRQRLLERAASLLGSGDPAVAYVPDGLESGDPFAIPRYLNDVRELSRNIERYNALADSTLGNFEDLSALLEYLFAERIARDTTLATPEFEEALRRAHAERIAVSPQMATSVIQRAARVVASIAGSAGRQLGPRRNVESIDPEKDLEALQGLGALVELVDGERSVMASVGDSAILGARLARAVGDSIAAHLELAAVRIAPDTLAPDSSAKRLRGVIGQLFRYRLMQPIAGKNLAGEIGPAQRLRWDIGSMELALSLHSEFLQAVVSTAEAFPGQDPVRLQRALVLQLRDRAVDIAAASQRLTPQGTIDDIVAEIRAQSLNLEGASSRLVRLVEMLDTLDAGDEADLLLDAAAHQGEQVLALAQVLLDRNRWLAPDGAAIAAWRGVLPLSFATLGTGDSLQFHTTLLRHETEIRTLAHAIVPALRSLRVPAIQSAVQAPGMIDRWESVHSAVLKYERGDYTSTMGALHRYLAGELMVHSMEACREIATMPESSVPSSDIFVTRLRQFAAAVAARCVPGSSAAAITNYQRLRAYFQTRLAGRYPFADTASATRVEAVVSDVRDFLRQYDVFAVAGEPALRSDPTLAHTARAAVAFLEQFAAVRPVLSALDAAARRDPVFTYGVTVAAGTLLDSLNTASVDVGVGERQAALDHTAQSFVWTSGDAVTAVLTPFDPSQARTLASFAGPWAALRFVQRPEGMDVRLFHPETNLPLTLPMFPVSAPEIVVLRSR
jgi:type VI secretion system protein ImpL